MKVRVQYPAPHPRGPAGMIYDHIERARRHYEDYYAQHPEEDAPPPPPPPRAPRPPRPRIVGLGNLNIASVGIGVDPEDMQRVLDAILNPPPEQQNDSDNADDVA